MQLDPPPRNIALFRALQLGDLLCAVPAFRALRQALPHSRITLIGLRHSAPLAARFSHYIDEHIAFPGYPGLPEIEPAIEQIPPFLATVQSCRFDLAIQMHGSGRITNPLVALFGARRMAGFHPRGEWCPDPALFVAYPDGEPEVRRHLLLLEHLGVTQRDEELEFPLTESERAACLDYLRREGLRPGEYVCVHAGSRSPSRRWPVERFAVVARHCIDRGHRIVLTGSAEERELTERLASSIGRPVVNSAGRMELGEMAALLAHARIVVCNDTGVSHIAAALRVPSVVIFSASDPQRWAPQDRSLHRVVAGSPPASTDRVISEVESLLSRADHAA